MKKTEKKKKYHLQMPTVLEQWTMLPSWWVMTSPLFIMYCPPSWRTLSSLEVRVKVTMVAKKIGLIMMETSNCFDKLPKKQKMKLLFCYNRHGFKERDEAAKRRGQRVQL